jgi:hypothetical protein
MTEQANEWVLKAVSSKEKEYKSASQRKMQTCIENLRCGELKGPLPKMKTSLYLRSSKIGNVR